MMKSFSCFGVALVAALCYSTARAQPAYTTANLHAHNDYEKPFPFWQAYNARFGSMEADIFLKDGALLVAHNWNDLRPERSLSAMYLNPLDSLVTRHHGFLSADNNYRLQLLIDLKSAAKPTLDALVKLLQQYPKLTDCPVLSFVISGNRPPTADYASYPEFIGFDGLFNTNYPPEVLARIPLISENLSRFANWNGKGILTAKEKKRVDSAVGVAHGMGKRVRFWNAPDTINAWYELMNARVDYINTDHIDQSAQFMRQLPKRTAVATAPYKLYTPTYKNDGKEMLVKNIILIIGDGMGLTQLYAGYTANKAALQTFLMRFTGLSKTSSADSYVTDSAPGSTAFSSGEKTNNRSVGVDANGKPLLLLPAILKQHQKLTGLITCGDITDATPADFYAHQAERSDSRLIVKDLQNAPIQLLMGAGNKSIDASLPTALPAYRVVHHLDSIAHNTTSRWFLTEERAGKSVLNGRGNWLQQAFGKAVAQLSSSKAGFFLMVEGAQVDYGGHANDLPYVVAEVQDLDRVVADAMKFADGNGETLVIVTADHETGGLTLLNGNYATASVSGQFATNDHTATPVPVFAYGPMAQLFTGVYENTAIFGKMLQAMRIKIQ